MQILNSKKYLIISLLILLGFSCSKDQDVLILDSEYLSVSDLLQYCQGSCNQTYHWEYNPAMVMGHIKDIGNVNTMQNYYENNRFFLFDIRTGINMEIKISDDKDAIFDMINTGIKTDLFYIKGIAEPLTAFTGDGCTKGMVLNLNQHENITTEN